MNDTYIIASRLDYTDMEGYTIVDVWYLGENGWTLSRENAIQGTKENAENFHKTEIGMVILKYQEWWIEPYEEQ